jgi:hypothetical protein
VSNTEFEGGDDGHGHGEGTFLVKQAQPSHKKIERPLTFTALNIHSYSTTCRIGHGPKPKNLYPCCASVMIHVSVQYRNLNLRCVCYIGLHLYLYLWPVAFRVLDLELRSTQQWTAHSPSRVFRVPLFEKMF